MKGYLLAWSPRLPLPSQGTPRATCASNRYTVSANAYTCSIGLRVKVGVPQSITAAAICAAIGVTCINCVRTPGHDRLLAQLRTAGTNPKNPINGCKINGKGVGDLTQLAVLPRQRVSASSSPIGSSHSPFFGNYIIA